MKPALVLAFVLAGCAFEPARAVYGRRWNAEKTCLENTFAFDVVDADADPPAACDGPRCYVSVSGEVYVLEGCDVPADYTDQTKATEGACPAALGAAAAGDDGAC